MAEWDRDTLTATTRRLHTNYITPTAPPNPQRLHHNLDELILDANLDELL